MRRLWLLALATAAYVLAASAVAPGFYDGFGPPTPYSWTCPPPQAGANSAPTSGSVDVPVTNGVSEPDSAFTDDGQLVIGFLPGAFDATGKTTIHVQIAPLPSCPKPAGIRFVTNVYNVTADAPLVKSSNLELRYSNLEPDPSDIYVASDPAGPWKALGRNQNSQLFVADTQTTQLGYFAAGYAASTPPGGTVSIGGGSSALPLIVAALIVLVIVAGIPLAIIRRRGGGRPEPDDER